MSLPQILLGLLESPASGYDLKKRFEEQQSHYWTANLAQIYPTLKRMEADHLLTSTEEPSSSGPPRRVYARTRKGKEALLDWLKGGPDVSTDRLSWLAQVGFLAALSSTEQRAFLLQLKAEFERHRSELQTIERNWKEEDPRFPDQLPESELFPYFTLRLGLAKYQTIVRWCDECLRRLNAAQTNGGEDAAKATNDTAPRSQSSHKL